MAHDARSSWNTILVKVPTPQATSLPAAALVEVVPVTSAGALLHASVVRADALAQLRMLRHRVEQLRPAREGRGLVLAVTSARGGEGASTLACQLAWVLGESDRARVALVEASFARPSLACALSVTVPLGLGLSTQIGRRLAGALEPWSLLGLGPNLHAALERPGDRPVSGALQSAHFEGALAAFAGAYDHVIIDAPPVLGADDAHAALRMADGILLAARGGSSRGTDLREAARALGPRLAGVVLVAPPE